MASNRLLVKPKNASITSSPDRSLRSSRVGAGKFDRRDELGSYINYPEKKSQSKSEIIFYDDDFVAIYDKYPKSSVHCLLLPRSIEHQRMHPFKAFENPQFLASVRENADKLKKLVAKELQRKYGSFSAQDKEREAVLNGEVALKDGQPLPSGRDWEKEVRVGVHATPSMNHLHIHVISVDRFSKSLKHRKHYNSFSTPFFVDLAVFPLMRDDARRHPTRERYLESDMKCWRCGMNFGNRFARLKEHLEAEFEQWKRE